MLWIVTVHGKLATEFVIAILSVAEAPDKLTKIVGNQQPPRRAY